MKTCSKCKIEKEDEDFYKDKRHKDGLDSSCKECKSKHQKKYRQSDKGIEWQKQYQQNPGIRKKILCRKKTRNLVRDWKLNKRPCEVCGDIKVEAHHNNYNDPFTVKWLCKKHHTEFHNPP